MSKPKPHNSKHASRTGPVQGPRKGAHSAGAGTVAASALWVRYRIAATLLEDAHMGSGLGSAGIDAMVARDRNNRPVIWASHLVGLLRDAACDVHGVSWARAFFGDRGGARRQALFTSLYNTKEHGPSRIWRSSARKAFDNRSPNDNTLRSLETVPLGTQFEGQVELLETDLPKLRALLPHVDAVGRGRASGNGRLRLELGSPDTSHRLAGAGNGHMLVLLRNLDPLCVTATATPDNLIPTLPYIPGRTLLGALAAWLLAEGKEKVAEKLVDGSLSVGDACPLPEGGNAAAERLEVLPASLSLQSKKPEGVQGDAPWWASPSPLPDRIDAGAPVKDKLKRPESDLFVFRQADNSPWSTYRPSVRLRLRSGRPDPNQADPSLFAIEEIAERTRFFACISGTPDALQSLRSALQPVLEGRRWLRVGRGGTPVAVDFVRYRSPAQTARSVPTSAYLILTSDLLVRDKLLRWCTAIEDMTALDVPGWPENVSATPVIQDSTTVYGFNGTSRLWRLPASGIRRGSVFRVSGGGLSRLRDAAAKGDWLGERTHEGFGRFRLEEQLPGVSLGTTETASASRAPDPEDAIAAETKQWLETTYKAALSATEGSALPSRSQWQDYLARLKDVPNHRPDATTAGGACWTHEAAKTILDMIGQTPVPQRVRYAELFIRWLRIEMRRGGGR